MTFEVTTAAAPQALGKGGKPSVPAPPALAIAKAKPLTLKVGKRSELSLTGTASGVTAKSSLVIKLQE